VKYEHVYKHAYASVCEARAKIGTYLDWYNCDRLHSSINDQTPDEAYWALLPQMRKAA
jgi:putative transposase